MNTRGIFLFVSVIALGIAFLLLARFSRRRNKIMAPKESVARQDGTRSLLLRPGPIQSWNDLWFGTLAKGFSTFGWLVVGFGIVIGACFIALALYAVYKSH